MKSKRFNVLFPMIVMLAILCLPIIADAEAVPWYFEYYVANSDVIEEDEMGNMIYDDWNGNYGPPLPIFSNLNYDNGYGGYSAGSSFISSSHMDVQASAFESIPGYDMRASAQTWFEGKYIATADIFQFSYNVNVSDALHIGVYDFTTSSFLYEQYLPSGSGVLNIYTSVGHNIDVGFGLDTSVESWNVEGYQGLKINSASLDYSTAVAPEPISSLLFVTGGMLLAGRRFIRRKA